MPAERIEEKFPGVKSCCLVHGYLAVGNCHGYNNSDQFKVKNFDVCHDKEDEEGEHHPKLSLSCHHSQETDRRKLDDHEFSRDDLIVKNGKTLLKVGNRTTDEFCLAYTCD